MQKVRKSQSVIREVNFFFVWYVDLEKNTKKKHTIISTVWTIASLMFRVNRHAGVRMLRF